MAKNDQAKEPWEQFSEVLLQYARPVIPEGDKLSSDNSHTGSKSSESRTKEPRAAETQLPSREVPSTVDNDTGDTIDIELADFRETGSKRLLNDLLFDSDRDGVALDQSRHGKGQPEALKKMLRSHRNASLIKVAKHIRKKKNFAVLDYPTNRIRFKT